MFLITFFCHTRTLHLIMAHFSVLRICVTVSLNTNIGSRKICQQKQMSQGTTIYSAGFQVNRIPMLFASTKMNKHKWYQIQFSLLYGIFGKSCLSARYPRTVHTFLIQKLHLIFFHTSWSNIPISSSIRIFLIGIVSFFVCFFMEINQNEIKRKSTMVCALNFDISPMFSHTNTQHTTHIHTFAPHVHILCYSRTAPRTLFPIRRCIRQHYRCSHSSLVYIVYEILRCLDI